VGQVEGQLQGVLVCPVHDAEMARQGFKIRLRLVVIYREHEVQDSFEASR
jgi:hypothetical protein